MIKSAAPLSISSSSSSPSDGKEAKMELPCPEFVITLIWDGLRECLEAEARAALAIILLDVKVAENSPHWQRPKTNTN